MLAVLHYDPKWVEYGFIDQQTLQDQFSQHETGADQNTEHYRYTSFCKLLDRSVMDDLMLERFTELALLDEDQTMAQSALAKLVRKADLTAHQLAYLKGHPAFASPTLQNIVEQTQLLLELGSSDLSEDLFNRCLLGGKEDVQRRLLNHRRISKPQLASLADYGTNRAVRNLAKEKLHRSSSK